MCTIENFNKLFQLDVNGRTEQKKTGGTSLTYLSWPWAWAEFKKIYPNATYTVKKDEQNRCYFGDEQTGYMVYTEVTADGLTYEMWLPVMDGANKAMKMKPYEYQTKYDKKTVPGMTMFDVNKTVMRCLVKNLAMFGLGLYIYAGEDLPEGSEEDLKQQDKPKGQSPKAAPKEKKQAEKKQESPDRAYYRSLMIKLCEERGIDVKTFAAEHNINETTTPEQFKNCCEELEKTTKEVKENV